MEEKDVMGIKIVNDDIKCKDCKWGFFAGPRKGHCTKFSSKPYDVYFEGADCPKYVKYESKTK